MNNKFTQPRYDEIFFKAMNLLDKDFKYENGQSYMDTKDLLIEKLEEYIDLLNDDSKSMVGIASTHGWKCPLERVESGRKIRKVIKELKEEIYGIKR